jgi:hypothetical protein
MLARTLSFITILSVCLIFISCNREEPEPIQIKECTDVPVEEGNIEEEEFYKIIDAVVEQNFNRYVSTQILNTSLEVIIGNDAVEAQQYVSVNDIDIPVSVFETYINSNNQPGKWKSTFDKATLINQEELDCLIDGENSCLNYINKFPESSGRISFTLPTIFDNDKAIIEYYQGPCRGDQGVFVMLEKINEQWMVKEFFTTIVS